MTEHIVIDPVQVQAYAQVLVHETRRAADAVGDELLVGPSQQDFCACGELRSTIPWLDAELTEIHDQVISGLNQIAKAGVHALHRAAKLREEEAVGTTVNAPGAPAAPGASLVTVAPQVGGAAGNLSNNQLANWVVNQQMTSQMWGVVMNQMNTTNPFLLPEGIEERGFDSTGSMTYGNDSGGSAESTSPYSPEIEPY